MRVLHVVESLDRGAVENWLMRMLEHARAHRTKQNWTFYCTLGRVGKRKPALRRAPGSMA